MTEYHTIINILTDLIRNDEAIRPMLLLMGLLGTIILPVFFLVYTYRKNKDKYYVLSFPTMKAANVYTGLTLLKGMARSPEPLRSYLTDTPCVWFSYVVQEQWKRTVKTVKNIGHGKTKTMREVVYGWSPLFADEQSIPFYLEDESGQISVNPLGAKFEAVTAISKECGTDDPQYYCGAPEGCIPRSTSRRRFIEYVIPLDQSITIFGTAVNETRTTDSVIQQGAKEAPFIISINDKKQYLKKANRKIWLIQLLGLVISSLIPLFCLTIAPHMGYSPATECQSVIFPIAYIAVCWLSWARLKRISLRRIKRRTMHEWHQLEALLEERKLLINELYKITAFYCETGEIADETQRSLCDKLKSGQATFETMYADYDGLTNGKIFLPLYRKLNILEQKVDLAGRSYDIYANYYNRFMGGILTRFFSLLWHKRQLHSAQDSDMSRFEPEFNPISFGDDELPKR